MFDPDRDSKNAMEVAADIFEQLTLDFPAEEVPARLLQLTNATESTRVQRCIVFAARGHAWYFDFLCQMSGIDFRDVIMPAEYDRLGSHLYDFNQPIGEQSRLDPTGERPQPPGAK